MATRGADGGLDRTTNLFSLVFDADLGRRAPAEVAAFDAACEHLDVAVQVAMRLRELQAHVRGLLNSVEATRERALVDAIAAANACARASWDHPVPPSAAPPERSA